MASLDRMEVDDNSSDGESSGEENPEAMSDKKAWLAYHTGGSACDAVWPETTSLELVVSEGVEGLLISVRATVHRSHFVQKSRKTNCVLFDPSRYAQVALRHQGG